MDFVADLKLLPVLLAWPALVLGQYYNISTIAGDGKFQFNAGLQAVNAHLVQPGLIAVDATGNIYVSDTYYEQVFQITPGGGISVYAGNGTQGYSGDGGQANSAQLNFPQGLAVDASGNLYIADSNNFRIRKVTPAGVISTFAALSNEVTSVAIDPSGNLYATSGQNVVKVDTSGNVTPFAGTGAAGTGGDGGPATAASFFNPYGLRVDAKGNVYVADQGNNCIRMIDTHGVINTVAGNGHGGFQGDGGLATAAELFHPGDVALDGKGNMYISDGQNGRIRVVNSSGTISTYGGGGASLADGPVNLARLAPVGIVIDPNGNVVFAEPNYRQVRRINGQALVSTVAGVLPSAAAGDNGPGTASDLLQPIGVAVDSAGNVFVADYTDNRIREISSGGVITTIAGDGIPGFAASGVASQQEIAAPQFISIDKAGDLFLADGVIQKISGGTLSTVAGSTAGFGGDGGPALKASLLGADDAVEDASGNIYIADKGNNRIRKVNASGIIETIAGGDKPGFGGDHGPSQNAFLFQPYQLALDSAGDLFIADRGNSRVREINAGGIITTVAGGGSGQLGDGGPATLATVSGLSGVAVDAPGNLYIVNNTRIRKVDAASGIISTIAGNGTPGFSGDGGLATQAEINGATGIAVDTAGDVYFTDGGNFRVRKLTPAQIVKEGVFNAATFQSGAVAPGEIITIFGGPGVSLGPATPMGLQLTSAGVVSTLLGGTQVTFDGTPAPLLYLSSNQINVVVPYEVAGKASTELQITVKGTPTNTVTLPVAASSPGVFAITNSDNSLNSAAHPAPAGGVVVLYGTGEGQTKPAGIDGGVNNSSYPAPVLPVTVKIAGQSAKILYGAAAPGFVAGVLQVDVQIPAGVSGTVPIQLNVGTASTPSGLTVSVK